MYDLATDYDNYTGGLDEIECAPALAAPPAMPEFKNTQAVRDEFFEFYTDTKPAHTHSCPTCQVVFHCDLPICKDWPFDVRCTACIEAGDKAAAVVEPTPRTPVKPYPNGALISHSLLAMKGAEYYGGMMI
jgi:hypothetical protein